MPSPCCPHEDLASKSLLVGHGQTPELRYFLFFTNKGTSQIPTCFVQADQEPHVHMLRSKPKLTQVINLLSNVSLRSHS